MGIGAWIVVDVVSLVLRPLVAAEETEISLGPR